MCEAERQSLLPGYMFTHIIDRGMLPQLWPEQRPHMQNLNQVDT